MGKASRAKRIRHTPPPWTPFERVVLPPGVRRYTFNAEAETFVNSRYQVERSTLQPTAESAAAGTPPMTVLSIKRLDQEPLRDWRDLQRIKNELAGEDAEGCEIFPAESRLYDTANQFWLWCLPPGWRFPFGFAEGRHVSEVELENEYGGRSRQRAFEVKPPDLETAEQALERLQAAGLKWKVSGL